jgi:hypothetical protein
MKEKLLFITPHLSTGGLPQYLLKQIEEFLPIYNIDVIEIANISPDYIVQKNKIQELVNIITLGDDKSEILKYINTIKPNIIHFQEIPEFNLPNDVVSKIFEQEQGYKIFVTTHGSWTKKGITCEALYGAELFVFESRCCLVLNCSMNS